MKEKRLLLVLSCLCSLHAMSQKQISFAYDSGGNRVKREFAMQPRQLNLLKSNSVQNMGYSELLGNHQVCIIPDEASGHIEVQILNLSVSDNCEISVFTLAGIQIRRESVKREITDVDISTQPQGVYLLSIIVNDSKTTWKIDKK